MRSRRKASSLLRRGVVDLEQPSGKRNGPSIAVALAIALAQIACGNAPPNDLLVPPASTGDSEGSAPPTHEGGVSEDATVVVPDATVTVDADGSPEVDGGTCSAASCDGGCCDMTGACVEGTDEFACGVGGAACESCEGGEACTSGVCGPVDASDEGDCASSCPACTLSKPCCTLRGVCGCLFGLTCL